MFAANETLLTLRLIEDCQLLYRQYGSVDHLQTTYLDPADCQKSTGYSEASTGVENNILKSKPPLLFGLPR